MFIDCGCVAYDLSVNITDNDVDHKSPEHAFFSAIVDMIYVGWTLLSHTLEYNFYMLHFMHDIIHYYALINAY